MVALSSSHTIASKTLRETAIDNLLTRLECSDFVNKWGNNLPVYVETITGVAVEQGATLEKIKEHVRAQKQQLAKLSYVKKFHDVFPDTGNKQKNGASAYDIDIIQQQSRWKVLKKFGSGVPYGSAVPLRDVIMDQLMAILDNPQKVERANGKLLFLVSQLAGFPIPEKTTAEQLKGYLQGTEVFRVSVARKLPEDITRECLEAANTLRKEIVGNNHQLETALCAAAGATKLKEREIARDAAEAQYEMRNAWGDLTTEDKTRHLLVSAVDHLEACLGGNRESSPSSSR